MDSCVQECWGMRRGMALLLLLCCLSVQGVYASDWDTSWGLFQKIEDREGDTFGAAVSITDDRLAVGDPGANTVNFYRRVTEDDGDPHWEYLFGDDGDGTLQFGRAVSMYTNRGSGTIVVGAEGKGFIFTIDRDEHGFNNAIPLYPLEEDETFGSSVAANDKWIVVGAPGLNHSPGAVYIFDLGGQSSTVLRGDEEDESFGTSVSISTLEGVAIVAVGAPRPLGGSVYVFGYSSEAWQFMHRDDRDMPSFGSSVDVSGPLLAIGVPDGFGSVILIRYSNSSYTELFRDDGRRTDSRLGAYVSVEEHSVLDMSVLVATGHRSGRAIANVYTEEDEWEFTQEILGGEEETNTPTSVALGSEIVIGVQGTRVVYYFALIRRLRILALMMAALVIAGSLAVAAMFCACARGRISRSAVQWNLGSRDRESVRAYELGEVHLREHEEEWGWKWAPHSLQGTKEREEDERIIAEEGTDVPGKYIDPISLELMWDPVQTVDGQTYERASIQRWLRSHDTSPATGVRLTAKTLSPQDDLRREIEQYRIWLREEYHRALNDIDTPEQEDLEAGTRLPHAPSGLHVIAVDGDEETQESLNDTQ